MGLQFWLLRLLVRNGDESLKWIAATKCTQWHSGPGAFQGTHPAGDGIFMRHGKLSGNAKDVAPLCRLTKTGYTRYQTAR